MSKENEFKTAQFQSGYFMAIQDVYSELTEMHHDTRKYDRKLIDKVWEKVKSLELRARNGMYGNQ